MKTNLLNDLYQPGQNKFWKGRATRSELGNQYWYQDIKFYDVRAIKPDNDIDIALLGYKCDEGVKRNLGRVGAVNGPECVRKQLAKLPIHYNSKHIGDFGDVICKDDNMEDCQLAFSDCISQLISKHIFPIGIGGGHDIAYAHFMGIREALKQTSKTIGIINFDAHFDLRPVESQPNSGTPFNQIIQKLKGANETLHYFPIGIQKQSNTKEFFDIAKHNNVNYVMNTECESVSDIEIIKGKLEAFISGVDYIYLTIDMDCFSSAYAPGVSAISPLGLTPQVVFKLLGFLFESRKVLSCDIAELNPLVDYDNVTSNLTARIIDFIVRHYK